MKLKDNIWNLKPSRPVGDLPGFHCYLIKDSEGLTLVDTSMPGRTEDILREIHRLGEDPKTLRKILLTHGDVDNIGNAAMLQRLTGCKVYASAEEIRIINGEQPRSPRKQILFGDKCEKPELTALPEGSLGEYQIYPTPGHTPGHVCYGFEGVLFAGDACRLVENQAEEPKSKVFCDDLELAQETWQKMDLSQFSHICTCHGKGCGFIRTNQE